MEKALLEAELSKVARPASEPLCAPCRAATRVRQGFDAFDGFKPRSRSS